MNIHARKFTENGHKFVAVPEVEFARLIEIAEDMEDIRDAREAKARIDAGEETFPAEFVYALCDAGTIGKKIALWREYRGLKRDELAVAAGVTGSYISMIENDKRKGDIHLFRKIADALKCDIDDLV